MTALVAALAGAALAAAIVLLVGRRGRARDAAASRSVLQALEAERDLSAAVLDTVGSLVVVLDREGRVLRFNRACEAAGGIPAMDVLGRRLFDLLVPAEHAAERRAAFARLIAAGGSSAERLSWRRPDGTERRIDWTHTVMTDATGAAAYVVATGRDVTEEIAAREELRRSEERFAAILETLDDFVWSQDAASGEMLYISPSVERLYGIAPDAMRRNTRIWLEVIHPDDRARVATYLPSLLSSGRAEAEYRIVHGDGSMRWVHDKAWAVRDPEGRTVRFDGIVRDITEHRSLETQFRQSQKMEAVGLLAGGIAHDFNNLLTAVGGYAEILLAGLESGDARRRHAEAIQRAAERASALTRQLLAFSRRQVLQPSVFDVNGLLEDLRPLLERLVGADVTVVFKPASETLTVLADPGQIEQVLMNLAVNARDAMPSGGRLTVRAEAVTIARGRDNDGIPTGSYACLSVSDTGGGMDDGVRARIFEPFFTTKELGKGTGLGLSTAYGIVRQSGGDIEVDSAPGAGTTFRVLLPLREGTPARLAAAESPPVPAGRATVLLVEDEDAIRELAVEVLEAAGFDVLTARDGREALEVARRAAGAIRLVVTDVVMPHMGGFELVAALDTVLPEATIVFMSGYSEAVVRGEARFADGAGFLQKPFTPQDLVAKAQESLDRAGSRARR
ncbi:MAG TPA: PAS domain S-box protein [Candidatus Polarisedimenticolaceae bacterium]|nr:PAS domain S-box protein [Candidatus Polarisedimenticolaceae bacterium]